MTKEDLKKGVELTKLIDITQKGLEDLKRLKVKAKAKDRNDGNIYEDQLYSFNIGEHKDGSGINASLSRYFGNEELLDTIMDKMQDQIDNWEEILKSL